MALRNGSHGYGLVSKLLHWLTVAALIAQFAVGLTMDADEGVDDAFDRRDDYIDALEDRGEDAAEARGEDAEEAFEAEIERLEDELDAQEDAVDDNPLAAAFSDIASGRLFDDGVTLPEIHILLGLAVIALGVLRVVWRATTPLPPWAPYLSQTERNVESVLEKLLLALLFVVPLSGLLLIVAGTDLLAVHIAAQIALVVVVIVHVGLVLTHTVIRRDRQLSRML